MLILEVAGKTVASATDVRDAINAAHADNKNSVLMRVEERWDLALCRGSAREGLSVERLRDGGCRRH